MKLATEYEFIWRFKPAESGEDWLKLESCPEFPTSDAGTKKSESRVSVIIPIKDQANRARDRWLRLICIPSLANEATRQG